MQELQQTIDMILDYIRGIWLKKTVRNALFMANLPDRVWLRSDDA